MTTYLCNACDAEVEVPTRMSHSINSQPPSNVVTCSCGQEVRAIYGDNDSLEPYGARRVGTERSE